MTIINHQDTYVKITSPYIQQLLANPEGFDKIELTGNINCCESNCGDLLVSESILADFSNIWKADVTTVVALGNSLQSLKIKNIVSLEDNNVLSTPVSLSSLGTIEDAIDAYFLSIGITTTVSVTLVSNILTISGLPNYFRVSSLEYGIASPFTEIIFGNHSPDSKAFIAHDGIYITPAFFGATTFRDGIYKFDLKYVQADDAGFINESNCAFIDITTKCKVASTLNKLLEEGEETTAIIHLLHYSLVNGSNCGCNCADLCKVYIELASLLSDITETIDCGC